MAMFSREELITLFECAEITIQSLDRPEPGAEETLDKLMAKLNYYIHEEGYIPERDNCIHGNCAFDCCEDGGPYDPQ